MALEGVSLNFPSPFIKGRFAPIKHDMSWLESVYRADAKIPWVQTAQKIAKQVVFPLILIAIFEGLVKNGAYLIANIAILLANRVYLLFHPEKPVKSDKENSSKTPPPPAALKKTAEKIDAVSKSASPLESSQKKQPPSKDASVKTANPLKKQRKPKKALEISVPPQKKRAPPPSPISSSESSSEEEIDTKHPIKEAASPRSPSSPFAGLSSLYETNKSPSSPKKSLSSATTEPISPPPGVSTLSSSDNFSGPMRRTSSPISNSDGLFSPKNYPSRGVSPMSIASTPLTPHASRPSTTATPIFEQTGASSGTLGLNGAHPVTRSLSAPAKTEGNG